MKEGSGIWHRTTLQVAQDQQRTYHTTPIVGQKRAFDEAHGCSENDNLATSATALPVLQKATSLPRHPPRLVASRISPLPDGESGEYSQRITVAATPTTTCDPLLSLSHPIYALPRQLVDNFSSLGIKSIYPWQKHCLLGPGLLSGEKNLVYSAPTGGGKSLVADVLMLKHIIRDRSAKALLVLPYVALVQEKARWLRSAVQGISRSDIDGHFRDPKAKNWRMRSDADIVRVVSMFGGSKIRATWHDFDIAVCTVEKVCFPATRGKHRGADELTGERSCEYRHR
jgi:hypothetical protein